MSEASSQEMVVGREQMLASSVAKGMETLSGAAENVADAAMEERSMEAAPASKPGATVPRRMVDEYDFGPPAPGDLTAAIARWIYERQAEIWPHLKPGSIPKPAGYAPLASVNGPRNPFQSVPTKTRSSDLSGRDALKVYNAMAFAMWRYEAVMNAHVIILWRTLGIMDAARATKIFSAYLNRAKKWAQVGASDELRRRRRERTGLGFELRYVYVHENGTKNGFHTHLLCTLPRALAKEFAVWSMKTLSRLARHRGDGQTIRVVTAKGRSAEMNVERSWWWYRYVMKQLGEDVGWGPVHEAPTPMREVLGVWPKRIGLPVGCAQLTGVSQDIGQAVQDEAGFVSRLERGERADIYRGLELDEGRRRRAWEEMAPALTF